MNGTGSHSKVQRSPLAEGLTTSELRFLDVAPAALPCAMKLFDPPAHRVSVEDTMCVVERVDVLGRQ